MRHSMLFSFTIGALVAVQVAAQTDEVSLVQTFSRSVQPPDDPYVTGSAHKINGAPVYGYDRANHEGGGRTTWMMMFNQFATDEQLQAVCKKFDTNDTSRCEYAGHPADGGLPLVIIRATEQEITGLPSLQADFIEVDMETRLVAPVSLETLRGMSPHEEHWGLDRINNRHGLDHDEAFPSMGKGIDIFSLDTGVNVQHPDFHGRARADVDFTKYNVWTRMHYHECEANNIVCANDVQGHGTHTAGIAASQTFGVAKGATVHAVKVLGDKGTGQWSWFLGAMDWVTKFVARENIKQSIITASLGGEGPTMLVTQAVLKCNNKGISVVVAAGNEGANACKFLPSGVPQTVAVGATDEFDEMSYFSNFGSCVDVFAPGAHIISLDPAGNSPVSMSGTSMSAPFVAGAAALILAENRDMTPAQLQKRLAEDATQGCIKGLPRQTPNRILYAGPSTSSNTCTNDGNMIYQDAKVPDMSEKWNAMMPKQEELPYVAQQYPGYQPQQAAPAGLPIDPFMGWGQQQNFAR